MNKLEVLAILVAVILVAVIIGCVDQSKDMPLKEISPQLPSDKETLPQLPSEETLPRPLSNTKELCQEKGGEWHEYFGEVGSICILPYRDGGQKCLSSSECEGGCVTNIRSNMGKEGICRNNTDWNGCYNLIESDTFSCRLDDIIMICDSPPEDSTCDSLKGVLFFD